MGLEAECQSKEFQDSESRSSVVLGEHVTVRHKHCSCKRAVSSVTCCCSCALVTIVIEPVSDEWAENGSMMGDGWLELRAWSDR